MIYVVEDESSIRELIVFALESVGYEAKGFCSGAELDAGLKEHLPQLIIMDIMLPADDGVSIMKRLHANEAAAKIPVILATAMGQENDKVLGLNAGADDYLVKPFGIMEMISRVKAVLRRYSPGGNNSSILLTGDLSMNIVDHQVMVGTEKLQLTVKEFDLLHCFMENEGRAFTREELLSIVWGMECSGETRTVDMHVKTLRQKLGENGRNIITVRNVGYRMD